MSGVVEKFFLASMAMWIAPLVIIYGFNYQIFPGASQLSSSSQTLLSGFLAVISVNAVIGYYIYMAMKEPVNQEAQPDPTFVAAARASITQPTSSTVTNVDDGDAKAREKVE